MDAKDAEKLLELKEKENHRGVELALLHYQISILYY